MCVCARARVFSSKGNRNTKDESQRSIYCNAASPMHFSAVPGLLEYVPAEQLVHVAELVAAVRVRNK